MTKIVKRQTDWISTPIIYLFDICCKRFTTNENGETVNHLDLISLDSPSWLTAPPSLM